MSDYIVKTRHNEMQEQFDAFHASHPEVWDLFQRFAFEQIAKGFRNYSSKGIFERIRWEVARPEPDPADFKLNNNYTAFYARWFMAKYPEHTGFFRVREQISHWEPATKLPPLGPKDYPESNINQR